MGIRSTSTARCGNSGREAERTRQFPELPRRIGLGLGFRGLGFRVYGLGFAGFGRGLGWWVHGVGAVQFFG